MTAIETKVTVGGGKYEVIHENGANLRACRHGEPWRDLCGDGLVLALAQRIEELEQIIPKLGSLQIEDGSQPSIDPDLLPVGTKATDQHGRIWSVSCDLRGPGWSFRAWITEPDEAGMLNLMRSDGSLFALRADTWKLGEFNAQ